jgi:hypothetical protein
MFNQKTFSGLPSSHTDESELNVIAPPPDQAE